jgi:hypothetical protein
LEIGVGEGVIEHVSYPIFPPGSEVPGVLDRLGASKPDF